MCTEARRHAERYLDACAVFLVVLQQAPNEHLLVGDTVLLLLRLQLYARGGEAEVSLELLCGERWHLAVDGENQHEILFERLKFFLPVPRIRTPSPQHRPRNTMSAAPKTEDDSRINIKVVSQDHNEVSAPARYARSVHSALASLDVRVAHTTHTAHYAHCTEHSLHCVHLPTCRVALDTLAAPHHLPPHTVLAVPHRTHHACTPPPHRSSSRSARPRR